MQKWPTPPAWESCKVAKLGKLWPSAGEALGTKGIKGYTGMDGGWRSEYEGVGMEVRAGKAFF